MSRLLYFCDETSFHDTWMAVGGIAIDSSALNPIRAELKAMNDEHHVQGEVKWKNANSERRKNIHAAYINYLFELVDKNRAHLHIRFAPFDEYDHKRSGRKLRLATVGKMHYQLLLHRPLRYYGGKNEIHVFPDDGVCTEKLPDMREHLNVEAIRTHKFENHAIKHIECRSSKREPMLQLLDVTLGALASYKNKRYEGEDPSERKTELSKLALEKTKLRNLDTSTAMNQRPFNLWIANPKWKKK